MASAEGHLAARDPREASSTLGHPGSETAGRRFGSAARRDGARIARGTGGGGEPAIRCRGCRLLVGNAAFAVPEPIPPEDLAQRKINRRSDRLVGAHVGAVLHPGGVL